MSNTQEAQEKQVKEAMETIYNWAKENGINYLAVNSFPQKEDTTIKIHMAYTTADEKYHNIILYKEKRKPKINYLKRLNEFLRHRNKAETRR